ncbi:MAG: acetyl-CoA C-acyltransferase [Chloroflexi bacterium]|nr:MAG: acetyl-CoA C-acyltransferase [Chloroflexota bacterium]
MTLPSVYIVAALRTPIGRHGGALSSLRPDDLAALVIRSLVERTGVEPASIEDVLLGCANQAGEDNRNVARMALLLAGLPQEVAGATLNRLCGSSMEAVHSGVRQILTGDAAVVIAGGVESMSRAPFVMPKPEQAYPTGNQTVYDTTLGWRFPNPKLAELFPLEAMGETAENIYEQMPISREEQDAFAYQSHLAAVNAMRAGRFDDEIVPVSVAQRKGEPVWVVNDEHPRADTTLEKLAQLRPVFRKGGTVTAGNASGLNDGAAAILLAGEEAVQAQGLQPMARIVSMAVAGVDPRLMGLGPVPASRKALQRAGLTVDDIGLVEVNEAFAVQALACIRELGLDRARVNVNGGAIALGHPLGCSGARILTTLVHEMAKRPDVRYGLATMCIGVGQGIATIVERIEM